MGTDTDVTARKKADEALREVQTRHQAMLLAVPDLMFVLDKDGVYVDYHAQDSAVFLTSPAQFLGRNVREIFPPEVAARMARCLEDVVRSGEPSTMEYDLPIDGLITHWEARVVPCDTDKVLSIVRDVTDRKRAEHEARQLRDELAHVGRVSSLGALTGSLAHEINQPLASIMANAQAALRLIAASPLDLAELRETLGDIVVDDRRAGEVLRRLRALLTNAAPETLSLGMKSTLEEILRLLHSDSVMRGISLEVKLAEGLPPVRGDRIQLQQVALNLLLNAFDAVQDLAADRRRVILEAGVQDSRSSSRWRTGPRCPGGPAVQDLRALLHDQAGRHGHGPADLPDHRQRAWRRRRRHAQFRAGHDLLAPSSHRTRNSGETAPLQRTGRRALTAGSEQVAHHEDPARGASLDPARLADDGNAGRESLERKVAILAAEGVTDPEAEAAAPDPEGSARGQVIPVLVRGAGLAAHDLRRSGEVGRERGVDRRAAGAPALIGAFPAQPVFGAGTRVEDALELLEQVERSPLLGVTQALENGEPVHGREPFRGRMELVAPATPRPAGGDCPRRRVVPVEVLVEAVGKDGIRPAITIRVHTRRDPRVSGLAAAEKPRARGRNGEAQACRVTLPREADLGQDPPVGVVVVVDESAETPSPPGKTTWRLCSQRVRCPR